MAALIFTKACRRPRLIYRIRLDDGPAKGWRKGFTETDMPACWMPSTSSLAAPLSWCGAT
ncbi:transposase [Streptomyces sp. NPDC057565]|uniref:transposase n=1 Tax=Streptomyces sp. NPDC057565 TaxID=3346169 RepID=UPI0036CA046A